jgi:hypothetical protein
MRFFVCERRRSRRVHSAIRAEQGWRAAVLDERASRHAFRPRASEEGSGHEAPASASGASNVQSEAIKPRIARRRAEKE